MTADQLAAVLWACMGACCGLGFYAVAAQVVEPHKLRRWAWKVRTGNSRFGREGQCAGCGCKLNADERAYYEYHCERCEGIVSYYEV
jgi:hypothetical protein